MTVVEINDIQHEEEVENVRRRERHEGLVAISKVGRLGPFMDPGRAVGLSLSYVTKSPNKTITEGVQGIRSMEDIPPPLVMAGAMALVLVIVAVASSPTILIALKLAGEIKANRFVTIIADYVLLGLYPAQEGP